MSTMSAGGLTERKTMNNLNPTDSSGNMLRDSTTDSSGCYTIKEYAERRLSGLAIDPYRHPAIAYVPDSHPYWTILDFLNWFDSAFSLENYKICVEVFPEHSINTFSISTAKASLSISDTVNKARKTSIGASQLNYLYIENAVWNPSPNVTVECRCCGLSANTAEERFRLFPKASKSYLGVRSECKRCDSLLSLYRQDFKKTGRQSPRIVGPYSLLKDVVRCTKCATAYPALSIARHFRRIRWSVDWYGNLIDKATGIAINRPFMFSSVCIKCERKLQKEPK